jgi:hypothetical protein
MDRARLFKLASRTVLTLAAIQVWTLMLGCKDRPDHDDEKQAAKTASAPAQITVQNGRIVLSLDAQSQNRLGIAMVALSETSVRAQFTAPAVVLPVQELANLRSGYVAAQAQLEKARANLDVAGKEYQRLKILYQDNQNASAKALEAAEGTMQTDKADVSAAQQQLGLQASFVHQQWGAAVAEWATDNTATLERVLSLQEMLVEVTIPPDRESPPPPAISLEMPTGERASASFASSFPRVDPRIQGRTFLYITPARSGLIPGVNLVAHLATGKPMHGFVVPESAIVWSEGQAWVYREVAANQFSRLAAATDTPVENGFLITKDFSPGDRVVVRGAQALLSEELLLQGQGAAAPDTDPD